MLTFGRHGLATFWRRGVTVAGFLALTACSDTAGPAQPSLADTWALETVNDSTLPHRFTDTIAVPGGDPVIIADTLLADTLELRAGNSQRLTWLVDGADTSRQVTDIAWAPPAPSLADSVVIVEAFPAGAVEHHAFLSGDRLTLRVASLIRPGLYAYVRVP